MVEVKQWLGAATLAAAPSTQRYAGYRLRLRGAGFGTGSGSDTGTGSGSDTGTGSGAVSVISSGFGTATGFSSGTATASPSTIQPFSATAPRQRCDNVSAGVPPGIHLPLSQNPNFVTCIFST